MPPDAQTFVQKTLFLSLSLLVISVAIIFGAAALGKACTQVMTYITYSYNAILKQEFLIP